MNILSSNLFIQLLVSYNISRTFDYLFTQWFWIFAAKTGSPPSKRTCSCDPSQAMKEDRQVCGRWDSSKPKGYPDKIQGKFGKSDKLGIQKLKQVTQCARCGVKGHWARERANPPDGAPTNNVSNPSAFVFSSFASASSSPTWWNEHLDEIPAGLCMIKPKNTDAPATMSLASLLAPFQEKP